MGFHAVSKLSQDYPKARLAFCGFRAADKNLIERLADLGVDPGAHSISSPNHGRLSRTRSTRPRCSNQSPAKGGCWSPQQCICRARSDAFGLPDFRWSPIR